MRTSTARAIHKSSFVIEAPSQVRPRIAPRISHRPWARYLAIALLAGLLPLYWTSFVAPAVGTFHDDGIYLVTAKALAEGKGYRIISLPQEPRQTKYPIGFPLLLAAVWKIFPEFPANVPVLKIVPVLSLLGWLAMAILLARRWGELNWAACAWLGFFCAGTHWAVFAGTTFLSDLLFGALALASIHFLLRTEDSDRPLRDAALAGAFCAAAYLVRTSALAIIAGGAISLLWNRRRRPAAVFMAICAAAVIGWGIWQAGGEKFENPILTYYTAQNYSGWNLITSSYSQSAKWLVALTNVFYVSVFPAQIILSTGTWIPWYAAMAMGVPLWIFFFRGWRAQPRLRTAYICLSIYIALVLLWAWPPDRFLTSLLPLFLVGVARGLPRKLIRAELGLAAALVLFTTAWPSVQYERATGIPWMQADRLLDWSALSQLHEWIVKKAEPGAVIMANFDPAVYLYTGHKAVRPYELDNLGMFYSVSPDPLKREQQFRSELAESNVRYVMRSSTDLEELDLARWVTRMRREGAVLAVEALPDSYQIFKVDSPHP